MSSTLGCAAFHITAITEHRYPGTFLCCGLHHLLVQEQPINIRSNLLQFLLMLSDTVDIVLVVLLSARYTTHCNLHCTVKPSFGN